MNEMLDKKALQDLFDDDQSESINFVCVRVCAIKKAKRENCMQNKFRAAVQKRSVRLHGARVEYACVCNLGIIPSYILKLRNFRPFTWWEKATPKRLQFKWQVSCLTSVSFMDDVPGEKE